MGIFQKSMNKAGQEAPHLRDSVVREMRLSWRIGRWLLLFAGGALTAAAFPPYNCTLGLFAGWVILLLVVRNWNWLRAALGGWVWGGGYAFFSFMWLREIHPSLPFFMLIVLGAYYVPAGWTAAVLNRWLLLPEAVREQGYSAQTKFRKFSFLRQILWCAGTASSLVLVEYLRHTVLPWNYFGVAFWKNLPLMQAVRWGGVYALSFMAAFTAAALALAVLTIAQRDDSGRMRYRRPWPLFAAFGMLAILFACGVHSLRLRNREYQNFQHQRAIALVQGGIPVTRVAGVKSVREALTTHKTLSLTQLGAFPDLVVWPETAIPYPLRGAHSICAEYRDTVEILTAKFHAPLLIGTLEFDTSTTPPGSLNSAVLVGEGKKIEEGYLGMYSKTHPVPFGEFVPMRRYLPEWVIKLIDMDRDLVEGKSFAPIRIDANWRIGTVICFEDVFPEIVRKEMAEGANMLIVLSEDGWYPTSSEPEQHLANALPRAIETGLPMVRSGNDCASVVILPSGAILWSMAEALHHGSGAPHERGMGASTATVRIPDAAQVKLTFYARFGDWVVALSAIILALELAWAWRRRLNRNWCRAMDAGDDFSAKIEDSSNKEF